MSFNIDRFANDDAHSNYLREIERDGPTGDYKCVRCGADVDRKRICGGFGTVKSGRSICGNCQLARQKSNPNIYQRQLQERELRGLCNRCGRAKRQEGRKTCTACLAYVKQYNKGKARP